jgi:2-dehydropantoate 2-reductase
MPRMRIVVVGAGSVGGYFGGRIAAAGSADVIFVARGAHLDALRSRGLTIESPIGNVHVPRVNATDVPATAGPADAVLFTVKLYDMESAADLLPPLVGPDTVAIPLQNGVDAVDMLTRKIGRSHVAGGTAYVAAVISEPGVIRHTAWNRLIVGELDGTASPRLQRLLEACRPAGFDITLSDHIQTDIWSKFVHLAVFAGMTALTRLPVGPLRDDPDVFAMWQAAVLESMAVAHAKGIDVPRRVFDDVMANVQSVPAQAKSSMLQDLERGRRLELPWLSGAVVRMGREVGVDTPIHRFIATVLNPYVNGPPT